MASSGLVEYLKNFKVLKGDEFTHTSLGYSAGSYYIPWEETEIFFKHYFAELQIL